MAHSPWIDLVGLSNPSQMWWPCDTYVSTRWSTFHASVASFLCVKCQKVRLRSTSLFSILQREWVQITQTRRYG